MSNGKLNERRTSRSSKTEESDDLIDRFAATLRRKNTKRAYLSDLRTLSSYGSISFENFETYFSPRAIKEYFLEHASDFSSSTIRRRRASLRVFFNWLNAEFDIDLTAQLKVLSDASVGFACDSDTKQMLNDADVTAILEATKHAGKAEIRDHSLIFVLYRCALRRSALASLDAESVRKRGGSRAYLAIRTKRAKYDVRISSRVLDVITNLTKHYRINSGPLWRSFSNNSRGKRLTPTSIYRIVQKTARRAGLGDNVTPDDLRLAGQARLLKAVPSIQDVYRHSQYGSLDSAMMLCPPTRPPRPKRRRLH